MRARNQDDPRVVPDTTGAAHRIETRCAHSRRIESLKIDARGDHRDQLPRRSVALVDEFGDLIARRNHVVAARHHTVVEALEPVLLTEALVPGGEECHAGRCAAKYALQPGARSWA